jgi:hypothetical protein
MAVSPITVQQIAQAGITPTYEAFNATPADGHTFSNDGRTFLQLKNTNGAQRTVTIKTVATVDGLEVADLTVTVPATTGDKMVGPFSQTTFGSTVTVTSDANAGLTIAAIRL